MIPLLSALVAVLLFGPRPAGARPMGIASSQFSLDMGCNDCHSGGDPPTVELIAEQGAFPGAPVTLAVAVISNNATQVAAGFNLRSSQQGDFSTVGNDPTVRILPSGAMGWSEATHSNPQDAIDDSALTTFLVVWTPRPSVSGAVTFTAWGNSVNLANGSQGDRAAMATADVLICESNSYYRDMDGDTFGNRPQSMVACSPPPGFVSDSTDCNDGDPAVHPAAAEVCNAKDDNCTLGIDEGLVPLICGGVTCPTTVPACVSGVTQTCTPICPDAGTDATPDAFSTDGTPPTSSDDAAPMMSADAADHPPTPSNDAAAPADHPPPTPSPDAAARAADTSSPSDAGHTTTADASTPPPDAGSTVAVDARPGSTTDTRRATDGRLITGGSGGCDCHIAGPHAANAIPLVAATLFLLTLFRRRRR